MKDLDLRSKQVKLTKSKLLWRTDETVTADPHAKVKKGSKTVPAMSFRSYAYKLPVDIFSVEHILVNGKLAWTNQGNHSLRTGILGGGGRFRLTRTLYDRCVVMQTLTLRDIPYYDDQEPVIVIIGGFLITEKTGQGEGK